MTVLFRTFLSVILLAPALFGQVQLSSGVGQRFMLLPRHQPVVLRGIAVPVPAGSARLTIDLATDVASNDLGLFVRFNQDVGVESGVVTATDFTSDTHGSGLEHIVISPASTPPLQTGTYYVALGVNTLDTSISGTITATVDAGGTNGTYIISTFDFDADGWARNFNFPSPVQLGATQGDPGSVLSWLSAGGTPSGFLNLSDAGGANQDFVAVSSKFLGNFAALANPRLEFDYRHISGQEALFPITVRIVGDGAVYQWTSATPPGGDWAHYRVPLSAEALVLVSGGASLAQALANVVRIEISMDQAPGPETNGLDNFALIGDLSPGALRTTPAVPVMSTFDGSADGWGRNYPPSGVRGSSIGDSGSTLVFSSTAGNPGGAIVYNEAGAAADDFLVAPPKFLGNLAAIPNPRLEFDYRHIAPAPGLTPVVVRLIGAGSAFHWSGPNSSAAYQHYRVPLADAFFLRDWGTAGFGDMLAAVERIEISADQAAGDETDSLDNVMLLSSPAGPLAAVLAAAPAPLAFSATAGDPNPAPQVLNITSSADAGGGVAWTAGVSPAAPWLVLSATSGMTPARVSVSVNVTGLAAGSYSTTISIASPGAANTPQTVPVSLTVRARATTPRINAGGVGSAATGRGPLVTGGLGSVYGINLGPADGVAAGFAGNPRSLPTRLQGVRALMLDANGAIIAEAPLLFANSTQINFQAPFEIGGRTSVQVVAEKDGERSAPETARVAAVSPSIFTLAGNRAAAQNADFSLNTAASPAARSSFVIVYLTNVGALSAAVPTGQAAPSIPLAQATGRAAATIGGVDATVLFLGLTPGLVGVAQANLLVPGEVSPGDQPLSISIDGQTSNEVIVSVR